MAPVRSLIDGRYTGSFLPQGSRYALWRHYEDAYAARDIFAHVDGAATVYRNQTLERFLRHDSSLPTSRGGWFAPIPFTARSRDTVLRIRTLQTGSRTFAISPAGARALRLPVRALLDLRKVGWGDGFLELRPEAKGAGTPLSRTKLRRPGPGSLGQLLPAGVPAAWLDAFEHDPDPLFVSLETYEGRPLGGQTGRLGWYALRTSETLLGRSSIKIAPTLECVLCPSDYREWLETTTRVLSPGQEDTYGDVPDLSTEVRLSPGNVRAAYFDASPPSALVDLCAFVSGDADVLEQTYGRMVVDAGRYLDELSDNTVYRADLDCFTWPKFGDIQVVFRRDRYGYPAFADEYKFAKSAAWYLAKDQVIVGGIGLVYVDLESVVQGFPSVTEEELTWHHDLYVLNVLRDHLRVIARFDWARSLGSGGSAASEDAQGRIARASERTLQAFVAASQASETYRLERSSRGLTVELRYRNLGTTSRHSYTPQVLGLETAVGGG